MHSRIWHGLRGHLGLVLKCGSVLFLFLLSVLVVACGANNTTQAPGDPPVTVTINLNQTFSSPTPPLAEYSCGAWATQATPAYIPNAPVEVYAKFVHNVDGNPVGMAGARANAEFLWPSDAPTNVPATTTSDGLAVFQAPMQPSALNHVVLIDVSFTSADGHACTDSNQDGKNNAAFFTAISASPTVTPPPGGGGGPPPGFTPSPCPTAILGNLCKTRTPTPTQTGG